MDDRDEAELYIERFPEVSWFRQWTLGLRLGVLASFAGFIAGVPAQFLASCFSAFGSQVEATVLLVLFVVIAPILFFRLCFLSRLRIERWLAAGDR